MLARAAQLCFVSGLVLIILGVVARCSSTPEALTPAGAFRQVCVGALVLEAEKQEREISGRVLKLCEDPELPGRIVNLLVAVAEVGDSINQVIEMRPTLVDAGTP